jgi:stage IV sporulation protein FB
MLRWRLFGISFCIQPSFWLMNALWAYIIYTYFPGFREVGLLAYILIWVFCTLISVMVHELGHVVTARIFGQPGSITLTGLGGQAVGEFGELAVWQRILVICAGPGAGFLLAAGLILFDAETTRWNLLMDMLDVPALKVRWFGVDKFNPLLRMGGSPHYAFAINILLMINLFVNVINLLPIIPMDGGMLLKEFCCLIAPKSGPKIAFGLSFILACALTIFFLAIVLVKHRVIANPFSWEYPLIFPELTLIVFAFMAYRCYTSFRQIAMMERHQAYMEDDDMSGPRHLPPGVEEVPAKDPDDFAPRAPGSERPRR